MHGKRPAVSEDSPTKGTNPLSDCEMIFSIFSLDLPFVGFYPFTAVHFDLCVLDEVICVSCR